MASLSTSFTGSTINLNLNLNLSHVRSTSSKNQYVNFSNNKTRLTAVWIGARYKGTHNKEVKLGEMIENKVKEAKEVCEGDEGSDECKVAWDEVEEVSQAKAHLRVKLEHGQDPMEGFCYGNPDVDECRVFDD